jgi:hypothetical protein
MTKKFQVGAGDKIKVFVALLPLGDRAEPEDVTITAGSGITSSATSITVTALSGPIPAGTELVFDNSTTKRTVTLTKDAKVGATSLVISPANGALTGSSTSAYTAKLRLLGGTQADVQIASDNTDVLVFEDPGGYKDGAITAQSWTIPWQAQLYEDDPALKRVKFAARKAITQREIYIWHESPLPVGDQYTTGEVIQGATCIMNFTKTLPSNGLCTVGFTFQGRGEPTVTPYA